MKFFKKRKKETTGMPDMDTVSLSTVLPSFSVHPLPYEHSRKFIIDGIKPLKAEEERIKDMDVDWLLHDMRDAAIKADSYEEISFGKRQYTNHTYCISMIIAENEGEIRAALEQEKLLLAEIEQYKALESELQNKEWQ